MAGVGYDYYRDTYRGCLSEEGFKRLSRRAAAYLDRATLGRLTPELAETEVVKDACCAVVDAYSLNERGGGVASETNDGISVTYVAGVGSAKSDGQRLFEAAALYLGGTGLLYRGCR